jgi:hypothetical protein
MAEYHRWDVRPNKIFYICASIKSNMRKYKFALTAGIGLLVFAACKKSSNPTIQSQLLGKWNLHEDIIDKNSNGIIDSSDQFYNEDSLGLFLVFNNNGTGLNILFNSADTFTWELTNNDSAIRLAYTSGYQEYYRITAHSSSSFTVQDTAHPIQWEIFNKE